MNKEQMQAKKEQLLKAYEQAKVNYEQALGNLHAHEGALLLLDNMLAEESAEMPESAPVETES